MAELWWTELSDDELAARLMQRGMAPTVARDWVQWRDSVGGVEEISLILGEAT